MDVILVQWPLSISIYSYSLSVEKPQRLNWSSPVIKSKMYVWTGHWIWCTTRTKVGIHNVSGWKIYQGRPCGNLRFRVISNCHEIMKFSKSCTWVFGVICLKRRFGVTIFAAGNKKKWVICLGGFSDLVWMGCAARALKLIFKWSFWQKKAHVSGFFSKIVPFITNT